MKYCGIILEILVLGSVIRFEKCLRRYGKFVV